MSSEAIAKPTITRNSSEFKQEAYASIPAGELVVFAVQILQVDATPVAVEEVVSTCFRLFPHSFALKNYFYWPDSALVSRRLHDAKEKGLLKGSSTDGYETKGSGKQIAKQVAKVLGVSLPVPAKAEAPVAISEKKEDVPVEKKEEEKKEGTPSVSVVKEARKQETLRPRAGQANKKEAQKKTVKPGKKTEVKKAVAKKQIAKPKVKAKPVAQKPDPKPKTQAKATPKKAAKPVAKQVKQKAAKPAPKPKIEKKAQSTVKPKGKKAAPKVVEKKQGILRLRAGQTSKKEAKTTVKPVKKKVEPKVEKKDAKSQPKQLTMALAPVAAWKKAEAPAGKPKVKKEALPVKGEVLAPVAVSKEEKDKAAKVIKQLERSDAYQLYRRNGKRAQIGEFDFRNMLFATMESSPETLKRNLILFKRYAGIHFRTDLIAFLEFCEESFSALLISKVKGKK